ncbi:MAG: hypothetical protein IJ799_02190 [Bacteroidales bacterium]|nr:hypothetical protein [Bacteroidales bacterium]
MMSDRIREVEIDLFAKQNEAIRLLAEANNELVAMLKMHAADEDLAPMVEKSNRAEEILASMGE